MDLRRARFKPNVPQRLGGDRAARWWQRAPAAAIAVLAKPILSVCNGWGKQKRPPQSSQSEVGPTMGRRRTATAPAAPRRSGATWSSRRQRRATPQAAYGPVSAPGGRGSGVGTVDVRAGSRMLPVTRVQGEWNPWLPRPQQAPVPERERPGSPSQPVVQARRPVTRGTGPADGA